MYEKGKKEPSLMHESKGYHGSPKETHKVHGGKVAGTMELGVGAHPGAFANKIKPEMGKMNFEKVSKAGKTGRPYTEE